MLKYPLAAAAAAALAVLPSANALAATAWEPWKSGVAGVFDLGGPRSDGMLVVAGQDALYTLSADGTLTRYAGQTEPPGAEAYLTVSPGLTMTRVGCSFARDDAYALRSRAPIGVTRIDAAGQGSNFANVPAGVALNGIAFDSVGAFGHRLLVTGNLNGKTEVLAIDCTGGVQVITQSAPLSEGGLDIAPMSFGSFGGTLIVPDEISGLIWSIGPDGTSHQVVDSGLPKGGDIGVEGVAFVPSGFSRGGGYVYYSDRATPNNPHPGTDHILRLSSADLAAAGVKDGDLLAVTEGGASMIAVHCDTTCHVLSVVGTPTTAHGEGHLVFTTNALPSPSPTVQPSLTPTPQARTSPVSPAPFVALAAVVAGAIAIVLVATRRR